MSRVKIRIARHEIAHWKIHKEKSGGLESFGIGLTKLRKFSRTIGRDPKLARTLWQSRIYEMKIIALLIDDPESMTIEQAKTQVEQLQGGYLAHVFSSCDATLAEEYFLAHIAYIEKTYQKQSTSVLMSMANALMGIGKRSQKLNTAALKVAVKIGPIDFDPDGRCEPMDVAKHLTSN